MFTSLITPLRSRLFASFHVLGVGFCQLVNLFTLFAAQGRHVLGCRDLLWHVVPQEGRPVSRVELQKYCAFDPVPVQHIRSFPSENDLRHLEDFSCRRCLECRALRSVNRDVLQVHPEDAAFLRSGLWPVSISFWLKLLRLLSHQRDRFGSDRVVSCLHGTLQHPPGKWRGRVMDDLKAQMPKTPLLGHPCRSVHDRCPPLLVDEPSVDLQPDHRRREDFWRIVWNLAALSCGSSERCIAMTQTCLYIIFLYRTPPALFFSSPPVSCLMIAASCSSRPWHHRRDS